MRTESTNSHKVSSTNIRLLKNTNKWQKPWLFISSPSFLFVLSTDDQVSMTTFIDKQTIISTEWSRIICADHTAWLLLILHRRIPWLVNIFCGEVSQFRHILPKKSSCGIVSFEVGWNIKGVSNLILEETFARCPVPAECVDRPISVKQVLVEDIATQLPRHLVVT